MLPKTQKHGQGKPCTPNIGFTKPVRPACPLKPEYTCTKLCHKTAHPDPTSLVDELRRDFGLPARRSLGEGWVEGWRVNSGRERVY